MSDNATEVETLRVETVSIGEPVAEPSEADHAARAAEAVRAARRARRKTTFTRFMVGFSIACQLAILGLLLRLWVFHVTAPIRFQWDLDNAWSKGTQALQIGPGYWSGIVAMYQPKRHTGIDYPPIRMYIKTAWVLLCHILYGPAVKRSDAVMWPMLIVNFIVELAGAVGMYFLCRLRRGPALSLLAACCLWFNPAVIFNTFAWTQWDVWAVAPVVWATYFLLKRRWFWAGICIGIGTMMKGQTLFAAQWFLGMAIFLPPIAPLPERFIPGLFQRNLPDRVRRHLRFAGAWAIEALLRLRMFIAGFVLVVFVATLPFTMRGSFDWFNVYHHQTAMYQPMSVGAWNFPQIIAQHYHWNGSQMMLPIPLLWPLSRTPVTLSIMAWLTILTAAWVTLIVILSVRARGHARMLMAPGIVFAVMFALLPGMHERYVLWASALLAPAVCVGPVAAVCYVIITAIGLSDPLNSCLGANWDTAHNLAPALQRFFAEGHIDLAWIWIFCAIALTFQLFRVPRKAPKAIEIIAPADRGGDTGGDI